MLKIMIWQIIILAHYVGSRVDVAAQGTSTVKYVGFTLSGGLASYREDLLVPLSFNGPGASVAGKYFDQTGNHSFDIRFKIGIAILKNRYSHEAGALGIELRSSWLKKLVGHPAYGNLWGGISIPLQMNNLIPGSWDDSHLYWLTAYSLGMAVAWQKMFSQKVGVEVRMDVPIFGWISRPPTYRYDKQDALNHFSFHFTEPNKSLHFETLDTYRSLGFQMMLSRDMRRSLMSFGLECQYNYCRTPHKAQTLNTSTVFSFLWKIGS